MICVHTSSVYMDFFVVFFSWDVEDWSSCSKTCGTGLQTRTVQCKQRISSDLTVVVNERSCDTDQPTKSQRCQDQPCTDWLLGNWTEVGSHAIAITDCNFYVGNLKKNGPKV